MSKKLFFSLFFSMCLPTMHATKNTPTVTPKKSRCGTIAKALCGGLFAYISTILFCSIKKQKLYPLFSYNPEWDFFVPVCTGTLQNNKTYCLNILSIQKLIDRTVKNFEENNIIYNKDVSDYYNYNQKNLNFIADQLTTQYGFKLDIQQDDTIRCQRPFEEFFKKKTKELPVITETGEKTTLGQILSEEEIKKLSPSMDSLKKIASFMADECEEVENLINEYMTRHIIEHAEKNEGNEHQPSFVTQDLSKTDLFIQQESEHIIRPHKIMDEENNDI